MIIGIILLIIIVLLIRQLYFIQMREKRKRTAIYFKTLLKEIEKEESVSKSIGDHK